MSIFHGAVESLSDDDDDDSENDDDSDSSYDDDTANNDDNEEMLWQRRIVGEELNYIAVRNINIPTGSTSEPRESDSPIDVTAPNISTLTVVMMKV